MDRLVPLPGTAPPDVLPDTEASPTGRDACMQARERRATEAEKAQRERSRDAAAALGIDIDLIETMWLGERRTGEPPPEPAPADPFEFYRMEPSEWSEISKFMMPQTGKRQVDWREICDMLLAKFNHGKSGCPWGKIPSSSTVRMAFMRGIGAGVWTAIGQALPSLDVRRELWQRVVRGAELAAAKRRGRGNA